jgi:hypothetical protein
VFRMATRILQQNCTFAEFSQMLGELRTRIHEDLQDRVFFLRNRCSQSAAILQTGTGS